MRVAAGEVIVREDTEPHADTMFIIRAGTCDITRKTWKQKQTIKAGQHFGESAMIEHRIHADELRLVTVAADTPVILW